MGITIGGGIAVGGGITVSQGPSAMRALLSGAGQTAFDAAAVGDWFAVSAADYGNVKNGLSGTSTVGYSDANLTNATTPFSTNFGATLDQANATVAANNYIIGLVSRTSGAGTLNFRAYSSAAFKGAYSTLGSNNLSMTQPTLPTYWLRKNPTDVSGSARYVAVGPRVSGAGASWGGTGTWGAGATGGGYSPNMTSWTDFNTSLPAQQWLLTSVLQW